MRFTLDARHQNPEVIKQVLDIIRKIPAEVEKSKVSYKEAWSRKSVSYTAELVDIVKKSANENGYTIKRMYSGPGHEAQYVVDLLPTTIIFVPRVEGHSHCELEYTPTESCLKGANVLQKTLLYIDQQ